MSTATTPSAHNLQLLTQGEAAALLTQRLGVEVLETTVASWRTDQRAQPLRYIRTLGRVRYHRRDVEEFARAKLAARLPEVLDRQQPDAVDRANGLLPGPILARDLKPAEAHRAWWLLHGARSMFSVQGPDAPHAARIDDAGSRAVVVLQSLVEKVARDAVEALAVDRAAAACGGLDRVEPEALIAALQQLAADFEEQRSEWKGGKAAEAEALAAIRAVRAPMREAVGAKLDALVRERDATKAKRDAFGRVGKAAALGSDLIAAGVPADRLAAVQAAIGEPPNLVHELDKLNLRVHELAPQIEKLRAFAHAAPGDYAALADWPEFSDLIAAERQALGIVSTTEEE